MAANEGTNGHTEVPSDLEKKIIKQIEVSCRLFLFLLICFSAKNPSEWLFTWEAFNSTISEKDTIFVLVSTITHKISLPRALVSALNVSILPLCVNRLSRK